MNKSEYPFVRLRGPLEIGITVAAAVILIIVAVLALTKTGGSAVLAVGCGLVLVLLFTRYWLETRMVEKNPTDREE